MNEDSKVPDLKQYQLDDLISHADREGYVPVIVYYQAHYRQYKSIYAKLNKECMFDQKNMANDFF